MTSASQEGAEAAAVEEVINAGDHICKTCQSFILRKSSNARTTPTRGGSFGCCVVCLGILQQDQDQDQDVDNGNGNGNSACYWSFTNQLRMELYEMSKPYGGGFENCDNIFSTSSSRCDSAAPTISISGEILLRFHLAYHSIHMHNKVHSKCTDNDTVSSIASKFITHLKQHVNKTLNGILQSHNEKHKSNSSSSSNQQQGQFNDVGNNNSNNSSSTIIQKEEQGYLSTHVLLVPTCTSSVIYHPSLKFLHHYHPDWKQSSGGGGKRRRMNNKKRKRQENQPYKTQGGDPRSNLQERLEMKLLLKKEKSESGQKQQNDDDNEEIATVVGHLQWTMSVMEMALSDSTNKVSRWASSSTSSLSRITDPWSILLMNNNSTIPPTNNNRVQIHVAVFRRPMYLYGYYTKCRRDISQTPFYVKDNIRTDNSITDAADPKVTNDDNNDRPPSKSEQQVGRRQQQQQIRLGISSVEEEISRPIEHFFGGISTLNNINATAATTTTTTGGSGSAVVDYGENGEDGASATTSIATTTGGIVYGMIKFHASGREDMDVRMVLRKPRHEKSDDAIIKARPFCVQIIDSLGPPPPPPKLDAFLQDIAHAINHSGQTSVDSDKNDDNAEDIFWYGNNPSGVGVEPNALKFVSNKAFSTLQSDTESKHKHYGCLVWTSKTLPTSMATTVENNVDLTQLVLGENTSVPKLPLTIQQSTPIRVLHRRSNMKRERNIYGLEVTKIIDEHHFFLRLTTQAGTYVKEFVHGDLQRTIPNMNMLLGGYLADLLELDCEGIQLNSSS